MKMLGYFLLVFLFVIIRWLFVSTKESKSDADPNDDKNKEPEKINNGTNEYTNQPATIDETNYLSKQIIDFLNKTKIPFLVVDGGNMIQIEYPFQGFNSRIDIYTKPNNHHVCYRILMIDEFPDDRFYKILELMARLNIKINHGKFNMYIEERVVVFDSHLSLNSNLIDENLHADKLQFIIYIFENFRKSFVKVAYENEEPILAVSTMS